MLAIKLFPARPVLSLGNVRWSGCRFNRPSGVAKFDGQPALVICWRYLAPRLQEIFNPNEFSTLIVVPARVSAQKLDAYL